MRAWKRLMGAAVILAVLALCPVIAMAGSNTSYQKAGIDTATVTGMKDATYTGQPITQNLKVVMTEFWGDEELIPGEDYTITYKNNVNAGTATVILTGTGDGYMGYAGTKTLTFKISKASNPMTVKTKTGAVKLKKVRKKKQKLSASKLFVISGAQGTVTYKKKSGSKKLSISKTGKITVKKGTKKGTYKLKVVVTAAGNVNYDPVSITVNVKVKVKK